MSIKDNLAYQIETGANSPDAFFEVRVAGIVNNWYLFDHHIGSNRAKLSASCLLTPKVGDEVLVFAGKTNNYIMSVLERANIHDPAEIMFASGAQVICESGTLGFKADTVSLNGTETVDINAQRLSMKSTESELRSTSFDAWLGKVNAKALSVNLVANQVSTVFGRLIARAKQSFRWIEGVDETRAQRIRMATSDRIQMTSKHTSIRAEGYVKIDGEKIDLG
jgi:hypothetical protein